MTFRGPTATKHQPGLFQVSSFAFITPLLQHTSGKRKEDWKPYASPRKHLVFLQNVMCLDSLQSLGPCQFSSPQLTRTSATAQLIRSLLPPLAQLGVQSVLPPLEEKELFAAEGAVPLDGLPPCHFLADQTPPRASPQRPPGQLNTTTTLTTVNTDPHPHNNRH